MARPTQYGERVPSYQHRGPGATHWPGSALGTGPGGDPLSGMVHRVLDRFGVAHQGLPQSCPQQNTADAGRHTDEIGDGSGAGQLHGEAGQGFRGRAVDEGNLGKIEHQYARALSNSLKDAADGRHRAKEERSADAVDDDIPVGRQSARNALVLPGGIHGQTRNH